MCSPRGQRWRRLLPGARRDHRGRVRPGRSPTNVKGTLFSVHKGPAADARRRFESFSRSFPPAQRGRCRGFSVYGATKAAIRNFARHWILDLKERRIRPSTRSALPAPRRRLDSWPAPDPTPMKSGARSRRSWHAQVPIGRIADPGRSGWAAVFLASDDSSSRQRRRAVCRWRNGADLERSRRGSCRPTCESSLGLSCRRARPPRAGREG